MKKILAACVLLMLSFCLAANAQKETVETDLADVQITEKVVLSVWTLFSGGDGDEMLKIVDEFNQKNDLIEIDYQAMEWKAYYSKLLTALIADQAPDIAVMHLSRLPDYASKNVLLPLDGVITDEFKSKLQENILKGCEYDNVQYAIPVDTHPAIMYYNKDLFDQYGFKVPETWDDMMALGKEAKKLGKVAVAVQTGVEGERTWMGMYRELGGNLDTGKTLILDRDILLETYTRFKELYKTCDVKPATYSDAEALWVNDNAFCRIHGVWGQPVYENMEDFNFAITKVPSFPGATPSTWGDSHSLVLPKKKDQNPQALKAAMEFIEYFSDRTYEWSKAGHFPANKNVVNSDEFMALPNRKDFIQVLDQVGLAPSVLGWSTIRTKLLELGESLIYDDMTPEQATDELMAFVEETNAQL